MSVVGSQQQTFLRLVAALRPHWRTDAALPARLQGLLARNRQFGSRDRRLYRELIYTTLRHLPWIEPWLDAEPDRAARLAAWLAPVTRDTEAFRAGLCAGWPVASTVAERAAFLQADPAALLPGWFRSECGAIFQPPEFDAQLARAPLWLRLQTPHPGDVAREFAARGWRWREAEIVPSAWQLLDEADVTASPAFRGGAVEIQDLGSQLVLAALEVPRGGRWLDACAGAGGKTLQLARLLGPGGRVEAHDIRPAALAELAARARRAAGPGAATAPAGQTIGGIPDAAEIQLLPAPPPASAGRYDGVLVDAPCSGSGTWRRSPHLKWITTPAGLAEKAAVQTAVLERYAPMVRGGGLLVYATCSLARSENEAVVARFLAGHPEFASEPTARTYGFAPAPEGLTILPARHDTDGFFVALLRRRGGA